MWAGAFRQEYRHLEKPRNPPALCRRPFCELGRYGRKTMKGSVSDTTRTAVRGADPEVAALVRAVGAQEAGIPQRQISAAEIVDRASMRWFNEGARILEEGYALRASTSTHLPQRLWLRPYRGGPMWHPTRWDCKTFTNAFAKFHQLHGEAWAPAPLLKRLAEAGKTFAEFDKEQGTTGLLERTNSA